MAAPWRRWGKRVRRWVQWELAYGVICGLRLAVQALPRRWALALGRAGGALAYVVLRRERRRAVDNLTRAFGSTWGAARTRRTARRVFQHLGVTLMEVLRFGELHAGNLHRFVTVQGSGQIDDVLRRGHGGIILTAHFGNWELLALTLTLSGYTGRIVVREIRHRRLERLVTRVRESWGLITVKQDDSPKTLLAHLRANGLLGILPDQDTRRVDGTFVPFFGSPAYTPTAPVALARASGAALIPCFLVREPDGRHTLHIEPPFLPPRTADREQDVREGTIRWSAILEGFIRRHPEQWVWLHRRWRTQPGDERKRSNGRGPV